MSKHHCSLFIDTQWLTKKRCFRQHWVLNALLCVESWGTTRNESVALGKSKVLESSKHSGCLGADYTDQPLVSTERSEV